MVWSITFSLYDLKIWNIPSTIFCQLGIFLEPNDRLSKKKKVLAKISCISVDVPTLRETKIFFFFFQPKNLAICQLFLPELSTSLKPKIEINMIV
jgi:hypothetical protein